MTSLSTFSDPNRVVERTVELLGGHIKAHEVIDKEFDDMQRRWNQDVRTIGRILRAHLYVEHYLDQYLEKTNPRLGPLAGARLSFAQKIELLDPTDPQLIEIVPGIKHLNTIRNRLAHKLSGTITPEDRSVFLSAPYFNAFHKESEKRGRPSQDPLDVLEHFAQYASQALNHQFSTFGNALAKALHECNQPAFTHPVV